MSNKSPNPSEVFLAKYRVSQIFTPSAPIDKAALFAGRQDQISRVVNTVNQKGQHAVLFGERGVGKTSLANVMRDFIGTNAQPNLMLGMANCEAASTFSSIWRSALSEIPVTVQEKGMGFVPPLHTDTKTMADLAGDLETAEDVRHFFQKLSRPCVVIIDEVDQLREPGITKALADTIKTLSDHSVGATLILVGVADSVGELISEHVSIERAVRQIRMQRMSIAELGEVLEKGCKELGMTIKEDAKKQITDLSQGLPNYTHLLALHAAQKAIDQGRKRIEDADVKYAILESVEQAQQSIVKGYVRAITSRRGNLYSHVITACALAAKDDLGFFSAADVREPMTKIMKKYYDIPSFSQHLNDFCEVSRGPILQKDGFPRRYRFRFINPMMEPYVVMRAMSKNIIESNGGTAHA